MYSDTTLLQMLRSSVFSSLSQLVHIADFLVSLFVWLIEWLILIHAGTYHLFLWVYHSAKHSKKKNGIGKNLGTFIYEVRCSSTAYLPGQGD